MKQAGILMPVASLPTEFGVGDFGKTSYQFVDFIAQAGFDIWQILPLNPLGFGNSPYQPYSSYAGDEIYISLDKLVDDGLLLKEELDREETQNFFQKMKDCKTIDYQEVRQFKEKYLKLAFERFKKDKAYEKFIKQSWVFEYGVFIALKKRNHLICWNEWPKEQQDWIKDRSYDLTPLAKEIEYEIFVQFEFMKQWKALKAYTNQKKIQIMGDLPFYVGIDSQDVWQNQEEFLLDAEGKPSFIAGVPPDYFSITGQRWGNPIYNWDVMKQNQYQFWMKRLSFCSEIFDITRIDHFRAFDTYWKIPSSCDTAVEGEWIEAPGKEFFQKLLRKYPEINIVVEDLGDLRKEVHELRDSFGFKGMKVLQFTFDPKENNNNFDDRENMIVYTGTHDNQTIRGWYHSQPKSLQTSTRKKLKELGYNHRNISWSFIEMAFDSVADMVIIPYQDFIHMDDEGRINTPGTLGSPNWEFKVKNYKAFENKLPQIRELIQIKKAKVGQSEAALTKE